MVPLGQQSEEKGFSPELLERARRVHLLALDVDGVLTDGTILLDDAGRESKRFHVRDGLGLRLLLEADIPVGIISARSSAAVAHRAHELGLSFCHQGVKDKWGVLSREMERFGLKTAACAYMGDDLIDLTVLTRVGFAAAPADAAPEVRQRVHWLARQTGGNGAVREMAEIILQAQGRWQAIVAAKVGLP